jgi:hypothetical protein
MESEDGHEIRECLKCLKACGNFLGYFIRGQMVFALKLFNAEFLEVPEYRQRREFRCDLLLNPRWDCPVPTQKLVQDVGRNPWPSAGPRQARSCHESLDFCIEIVRRPQHR